MFAPVVFSARKERCTQKVLAKKGVDHEQLLQRLGLEGTAEHLERNESEEGLLAVLLSCILVPRAADHPVPPLFLLVLVPLFLRASAAGKSIQGATVGAQGGEVGVEGRELGGGGGGIGEGRQDGGGEEGEEGFERGFGREGAVDISWEVGAWRFIAVRTAGEQERLDSTGAGEPRLSWVLPLVLAHALSWGQNLSGAGRNSAPLESAIESAALLPLKVSSAQLDFYTSTRQQTQPDSAQTTSRKNHSSASTRSISSSSPSFAPPSVQAQTHNAAMSGFLTKIGRLLALCFTCSEAHPRRLERSSQQPSLARPKGHQDARRPHQH